MEIQGECMVNKPDDTLPYSYFEPSQEGKLTWVCGEDADGKITSVFVYDFSTHKDRKIAYLKDIEEARFCRDELVKAGWQKLKTPEVTFTFPGEKEQKTLNRKQKRYLQRKVKKLQNQNPFTDGGSSSQ